MALIKDGKVYRNLQEQVIENTKDIENLIKSYGFFGPYDTLADIPSDDLIDKGLYLIGTGMPYQVNKYDADSAEFTNIGVFDTAIEGPQGPQGETGPQGPQGPQGEAGVTKITLNGTEYTATDDSVVLPDVVLSNTNQPWTWLNQDNAKLQMTKVHYGDPEDPNDSITANTTYYMDDFGFRGSYNYHDEIPDPLYPTANTGSEDCVLNKDYLYWNYHYSTNGVTLDTIKDFTINFKDWYIGILPGQVGAKEIKLPLDNLPTTDGSYELTATTEGNKIIYDWTEASEPAYEAGYGIDITGNTISVDSTIIPTVDYPVTDVEVNGTSVLNNKVAEITVPTKTSDLDNDSDFITNTVNNLTNYTKTSNLAAVATTGDYDDLWNKPIIPTVDYPVTDVEVNGVSVLNGKTAEITIPAVPTKTSDLTNDSGFITNTVNNLTNYTPTSSLATVATTGRYSDIIGTPDSLEAGYGIQIQDSIIRVRSEILPTKTSDLTNDSGFITNTVNDLTNYTPTSSLATVATTGSYNDLSNTPTIPTATSDLTNDSGFITSSDLPTNHVTTDTTQTITGAKTFTGNVTFNGSSNKKFTFNGNNPVKMIAPSSSTTGFTLYNSSNAEKGYLQYNSSQDGLYLGRYSSNTSSPTYTQEIGFLSEAGSTGYKVLMPNLTVTGSASNNVNYMALSVNNTKADSTGNITLNLPTVPEIGNTTTYGYNYYNNWLSFFDQFPKWKTSHFTDSANFTNVIEPSISAGADGNFKLVGGVMIRHTAKNCSIFIIPSEQNVARTEMTLKPIYGQQAFTSNFWFPDCRVRQICTVETSGTTYEKYGTVYIVCLGYSPVDMGVYLSPNNSTVADRVLTYTRPSVSVMSQASVSTAGEMTSVGSTTSPISNGTPGAVNTLVTA